MPRDRRHARPPKESDGGHPHLRVRVPKDVIDNLQEIANRDEEGNLSRLVRKILENYVGKRPPSK